MDLDFEVQLKAPLGIKEIDLIDQLMLKVGYARGIFEEDGELTLPILSLKCAEDTEYVSRHTMGWFREILARKVPYKFIDLYYGLNLTRMVTFRFYGDEKGVTNPFFRMMTKIGEGELRKIGESEGKDMFLTLQSVVEEFYDKFDCEDVEVWDSDRENLFLKFSADEYFRYEPES